MKRKIFAAMLAFVILLGAAVPTYAEEEPAQESEGVLTETIYIRNVEDFLSFAENCTLDSWSLGKKVVLQTDLSLTGKDFGGIATFGGTFEGNGHTISGLVIEESIAPAGLFRYLQPTAAVRNLKVSGQITPDGDASAIGGIAGENHGSLDRCSFSGSITGQLDTGGIAGRNYGVIRGCSASGKLTGENRTGGIAGYNEGTIDGCENSMEINVDSVDPAIDPTAIDLDFNMDMSQLSSLDTSDAAKDTGGIAGYSAGVILNCSNSGPVGYPHIGYNLGGILGRNCGFVGDCRNTGLIQGRKDVGGIAGQIEPNIATILSPDYLETLSKQFENLGGLTSAAGRHAAEAGDEVQGCVQRIAAYESSARAALESLASGLVSNIGSGEFGGSVDTSSIQALGSAIQGMANATNDLQNIVAGGVEEVSNDASAISGQINSISRTFALATEDAKKETVTDISDLDLGDVSDGKLMGCTNDGTVEADLNVGGVVGMMGLEYEVDPEDDAPSGSATQRRRYELKAIVQECTNTGTVTAKRSYAGSICGRMELGLIFASRGYGVVSSENGDYVGGIAGMAGGTVQQCFAKCTLSGKSYIGGIVGCGIGSDYSGESSTVRGCYSMVDIMEAEQFVGGISGANIGVFTGNYFVSDTLAGINGVSYSSLAEPMSYEALRRTENLPQVMRQFTLSFIADGEIIKEIPFDYGDSFDFSVYPEIPEKDGCYAQWSTNDLTDLRFDKQVEVEYYPHITALNSQSLRSDGRSVLFVQGKFKSGDTITVVPGEAEFPEDENTRLLERWHISIPADGLESHSIRILPVEEEASVYLLKNGIWSKLSTEAMGSYLEFEAPGAEVEIAVVSESAGGPLQYLLPAALVILLLLILLIVLKKQKRKKASKSTSPSQEKAAKSKKRKRWIWLFIALCIIGIAAAVGLYYFLPQTKVVQGIRAYDILNTWLEQPEQEMELTVKAQIAEKDADFTAQIKRTRIGDTPVSVIAESGRKLYFADGVVFLENGNAYRLNQTAPDYTDLLGQVLDIYKLVEVEAVDGIYSVTAEGEQATAIMKLLMPSTQKLLPDANRITVDMITEEGALTQIRFTGAGNLTDSVKTPFSLSATLTMLPTPGSVEIPGPVSKAISSGNTLAQELYSDDLVLLMEAWSNIRGRDPLVAEITAEADCGPISLQDSFLFYQWKLDDNLIWGAKKQERVLYFTEEAICDEDGKSISMESAEGFRAVPVLDLAYRCFSKAEFGCRDGENARIYSVALDQDGMALIAEAIAPDAAQLDIHFEKGSIQLVISQEQIQSIQISCSGTQKVLAASVDVQFGAQILFRDEGTVPELPDAVKDALNK